MPTITKRHNARFARPANEAAKLFGEKLDNQWMEPMTLFDAHKSYAEVWLLKSGKFLTISANDAAFTANVTDVAPCRKGRVWEQSEYYDICDTAGIEYDFMPRLRENEALARERRAMGI